MTPVEEFEVKKKELKEKFNKDLELLELELHEEQKHCDHEWVFVKELFYACGITGNGDECSLCGKKRHLNDRPKPSFWSKLLR